VIARNGDVELAFDVEGDGPDLLLVAGTASTRAIWTLVRPAIARSFRTIAFDNRDAGESTVASTPYALRDLARDAGAVLDAAGSRSAHVVGHSMGGAIAQELALSAAGRVRSLTLVSTWARGDAYTRNLMNLMIGLTRGLRDDRTLLETILFAGAGISTLRSASLQAMTDAALALGRLAPRDALERQWRLDETVDTLERLSTLTMPVLVVTGTEDRLLPSYLSEQIAAAIPGATLLRMDGVGHVPMIHAPEAFSKALLQALEPA
jgi:pimeloyl-ACP methyl ester carboxylesterase